MVSKQGTGELAGGRKSRYALWIDLHFGLVGCLADHDMAWECRLASSIPLHQPFPHKAWHKYIVCVLRLQVSTAHACGLTSVLLFRADILTLRRRSSPGQA